ncbi:MAG: hypothetical protein F6K21_40090 [Symploca sp. SIO2D2]|nr:hypothetical protein [Symploca sp. SIO2D2]
MPSQFISSDPMLPGDPFDKDTYYQILLVEPDGGNKPCQNIKTSILAKQRGETWTLSLQEEDTEITAQNNVKKWDAQDVNELEKFHNFKLDTKTVENLKDYPKHGQEEKLSSYLPSPGVIFSDNFINSFTKQDNTIQYDTIQYDLSDCQTQLGNYYTTMRFLLHSRKISQLVAKTWWAYLDAKEKTDFHGESLWTKFCDGKWQEIYEVDSNILDGLIAREIFLYGGADSPDNIYDEDVYLPLKPHENPNKSEDQKKMRFLILPTSKAWQGISLSLLLAGQAYYMIQEGSRAKLHQINPSILSTGEITMQYTLEVDWNRFYGDIKEIIFSNEKPWIGYHVVMPYPPIPAEANIAEINRWAFAYDELPDSVNDSDERKYFPFYKKDKNSDKYLIDVDYFRPPYPYIPLTCT